jgi:phosphomevalonate kinase
MGLYGQYHIHLKIQNKRYICASVEVKQFAYSETELEFACHIHYAANIKVKMKSYYFAEASTIEKLNFIIKDFTRENWKCEGKLIVMCHKGEVSYIQKLMYKRTWLEYFKDNVCIR